MSGENSGFNNSNMCDNIVMMEYIKVEIVDMSDTEQCSVKDEDTDEQRGWCLFSSNHHTFLGCNEKI